MINFNKKENKIPNEFKKLAKDFSEKGFIITSSNILLIGLEQDRYTG